MRRTAKWTSQNRVMKKLINFLLWSKLILMMKKNFNQRSFWKFKQKFKKKISHLRILAIKFLNLMILNQNIQENFQKDLNLQFWERKGHKQEKIVQDRILWLRKINLWRLIQIFAHLIMNYLLRQENNKLTQKAIFSNYRIWKKRKIKILIYS